MSKTRSIPSLDGLRALSVVAVILFHTPALVAFHWLTPFRNGGLGVTCFFVISGLLITKLLLNEIDATGGVNLTTFYVRRSFRIFPPFYAYLLVVGVLVLLHVAHIDLKSYLYSAAYLRNYAPHPTVELLAHTWSLSLEEQFYLVWPACLFFFTPRTCLRIAAAAILISPVSRVLTYALVPSMRDHINMMLHTRLDAIMVGAFLTLAIHQGAYTRLLKVLAKPLCLVPVALYFLVQPALDARFKGSFSLTAGFSLDAIGCGIVILFATTTPDSWLGRILNLRWLRHLGIISYSLYLWQQIFTGEHTFLFPLNLLAVLACAEASFFLIERPSLRWRNHLMRSRESLPDAAEREDTLAATKAAA